MPDQAAGIAFNGRLRKKRKLSGRNLAALAVPAGISVQFLSELERGNRRASPEVFVRICDELGVGTDERETLVAARGPAPRRGSRDADT